MLAILATSLSSGCSRKTKKQERAAISKSKAETRKIPEVTEQEIKYSNETGKITTLAAKLNASRTPETAKAVEEEIKKSVIFVEEYLQDHPQTSEGAEALQLIASTYQVVDSLIGNQQEQIAKAYKLIISLYPDSPQATEARNWLDTHKQ